MDGCIIVSNCHGYSKRNKKPIKSFLVEDNSVIFQSLNSLL